MHTLDGVQVAGALVVPLLQLAPVQRQHARARLLQPLGKRHGALQAAVHHPHLDAHGQAQLRGQQLPREVYVCRGRAEGRESVSQSVSQCVMGRTGCPFAIATRQQTKQRRRRQLTRTIATALSGSRCAKNAP